MILWCDGAHDARENMRRDAALLQRCDEPGAPPPEAVLRLFRFDPPGITLGHAQDPACELDLERCAAAGVTWALRPTGGRAIYHAEEWTYSFTARRDDPQWGGSLATAYQQVARVILASLHRLGVPAEGARSGRGRSSRPSGTVGTAAPPVPGPAAPCFASTARHEIVLAGRKLVGSAQRRTARALLQQGSLLLGAGHLRLADYLALPEARRAWCRATLDAAAADAGRWLGPVAPLERWAEALMAVLPPGTQRVEGTPDLFPLTLEKSGSYTPLS